MAKHLASEPKDSAKRDGQKALWTAMRSIASAERDGPPLDRADRDAPLPASFMQQRLWFLDRLSPGSPVNTLCVAYRMQGGISRPALERALSEMVARHEVLRSTLEFVDGRLLQRIRSHAEFKLVFDGMESVAPDLRLEQAWRRADEEARRPFDVAAAPLLRASMLRISECEHLFVLCVHHAAFDGWSFDVFMRELCALYGAFIADRPSPLAAPTLQYADYAAWQRRWMQGPAEKPLSDYWRQQMAGPLPVLRLPATRSRIAGTVGCGAQLPFSISRNLTQSLRDLAEAAGATPYMALLAAYKALLHRYTGADDLIVISPVSSRNRHELANVVGPLINTLALRTSLEGRPSFLQLLSRVRSTVLGAYAHQHLPFERQIAASGDEQHGNGFSSLQTMFAYQNVPRSEWAFPGIEVEARNVGNGAARLDLTVFVWENDGRYSGHIEYDADRFEADTMSRLLAHYATLLEGLVESPDAPIDTVRMQPAAIERESLSAYNDSAASYPRDMPIHRVFEAQARSTPDACALTLEDRRMSYDALNRQANRLARHLIGLGAGPGKLVAFRLDPSFERIVALLAILKTGAAYLPLNPSDPAPYAQKVLRDSQAHLLLGMGRETERLSLPGMRVVALDGAASVTGDQSEEDCDIDISADGLAYVMYTSGSAGVPKGVRISHRGVVRLVRGANYADLSERDVFLQLASPAFDASTFEIWGALLNGACLALLPSARASLHDIVHALRRHKISILWLSCGLFEALVDTHAAALANGPQQLLVGGDAMSSAHARRLLDEPGHVRLINCYGPTENTTFTTFYPVPRSLRVADGGVPIGRPVSNTQIYVLDAQQRPVPADVVGEAYVGGDGLMLGYLGDDGASGGRLIPNPLNGTPGERLYRTGDLVRRRQDGLLEFVGRMDGQIKIRGFRIEPAEVETAICACAMVSRCAVVAVEDGAGDKRLVAYIVAATTNQAQLDQPQWDQSLRFFLRERLPGHMIPAEFVRVPTLPLNESGKVDRKALKAISSRAEAAPIASAAPVDIYEREVAQAFEQTLHLERVGWQENFFDAGGDSLGALLVIDALETTFGTRIPLSSLFKHPTIEGLAAQIRAQAPVPEAAAMRDSLGSSLVEIKRGSTERCLFFVPGGRGGKVEMTLYAALMGHVERDQAIYGLLGSGFEDERAGTSSIFELARDHVRAMRSRQPEGPYMIGGECIGGLVAYEMAQQLAESGIHVGLLLMMDTWCPSDAGKRYYQRVELPISIMKSRFSIAGSAAKDLLVLLRDRLRGRPSSGLRASACYLRNVLSEFVHKSGGWLSSIVRAGTQTDPSGAAGARYIDQAMAYRPRRYDGELTLLTSRSNQRRGIAEGWRPLVPGRLAVHTVPGDHESYIRDNAAVTARTIEACLDHADPRR